MRAGALQSALRRLLISRVVLVIVGLLLGFGIFAYFFGGVPQVALIEGPIGEIDETAGLNLRIKLALAAADPQIKAVVIRVNSPGGFASTSEDLFTNVLHLREKKPVVVVVDGLAASGAYFMAVAANHIVAQGTSVVGSVGAILVLPSEIRPDENVIPTGPYKLMGGTRRTYLELLELVKDAFGEAVLSQRQDRLRLSRDELLQARIYLGIEALQLGLVDQLGTQADAVVRAAELARLRRYDVVLLEQKYRDRLAPLASAEAAESSLASPTRVKLSDIEPEFPYIYYLFAPP